MFRGHAPGKDLPETLLSVYMAKKRADEVAPGVGEDTDMFSIGPPPGSYSRLAGDIQDRLDDEYRQLRDSERLATAAAEGGMKDYVEQIFRQQALVRAPQEALPDGANEEAAAVDNAPGERNRQETEPDIEH